MSSLILFGAGASRGSQAAGAPPVGAALFQALRHFNPPGWGALPADLASAFEADFERGMVDLSRSNAHAMPVLQRAMAAYFFRFAPGPDNLYLRLAKRLRNKPWAGALATLNYERLLEMSLLHAGVQPVVNGPSAPPHKTELCLPHGCCHLFCEGARGISGAVSFSGTDVTTDGDILVISDPGQFGARINGDAFPPVMSYFEPNKRTTAGASFIAAQRSRLATLVDSASTIAIVGVKVRLNDSHVWGPLETTSARLFYCAGATAARAFREWAQSTRVGKHDIAVDGYFAEAFDAMCEHAGVS